MMSPLTSSLKKMCRAAIPARWLDDAVTATVQSSFPWFGVHIPRWAAEQNFLLIGAQGSGKTLASRDLMRAFLPQIDSRSRGTRAQRAIIYDVKLDLMSELAAMGLRCPVISLNPFDQRSWAWDIAADVTDQGTAYEFAAALLPERRNDNPFFPGAGRALCHAVITMLMNRLPGEWTLRDVMLICYSKERLQSALKATDPVIRERAKRYLHPAQTFNNVSQTLINELVPLESVAAIWGEVPKGRRLSIRKWASTESSVVVLGRNERYSETLTAINRLILKTAVDVQLSGPEVPAGEWTTWFFCDELRMAGRLEALAKMLTAGRSKGIRACLGFQDVEGLHDVYGEKRAEELIGLFGNVSLLRITSPRTAKWAAERIGQAERVVTTQSRSFDRAGNRTGRSEAQAVNTTDAVLASEFMGLPTSRGGRVEGFHILPSLGGIFRLAHTFPLFNRSREGDFEPRRNSGRKQMLRPWDDTDNKRLGLVADENEQGEDAAASTSEKPKEKTSRGKKQYGKISIGRINPPQFPIDRLIKKGASKS